METLVCNGGSATNACGGCSILVGSIGDPCGGCLSGALDCDAAGTALVCANETACDDPCAPIGGNDGNDTFANAFHLGDYDDGDNDWIPHEDWLHSSTDIDVFSAHVDDTSFATLTIIAQLSLLSEDYDLCVFWERDDGDATQVTCPDSNPAATMNGLEGCCSENANTTDELITLEDDTGGFGVNDAGTLYYVVTAYEHNSCNSYELSIRF